MCVFLLFCVCETVVCYYCVHSPVFVVVLSLCLPLSLTHTHNLPRVCVCVRACVPAVFVVSPFLYAKKRDIVCCFVHKTVVCY